jgi:hypothetical protein
MWRDPCLPHRKGDPTVARLSGKSLLTWSVANDRGVGHPFYHSITEFKKEDRKRKQELEIKAVMNKNRKFLLLTIAMLPMIGLLAFAGCSSMNATAKDNTAVRDRTGYYLDGNAPEWL